MNTDEAFSADWSSEVLALVEPSSQPLDADWYDGPSLLQLLERLPTAQERSVGDLLIFTGLLVLLHRACSQPQSSASHSPA